MSGYPGDLSPKQEELLHEFKTLVKDVLNKEEHDDRLLLQFLRARNFDLQKTEDMFRKHICWRKKFPKKFLLREYKPPEIAEKYLHIPFVGFDKQGNPIRIIIPGAYDIRGLFNSITPHEIFQYVAHILERDIDAARVYNEKFNRYVEGRTLIFDLAYFKLMPLLHKPTLTTLIAVLKLFEANYPESLKAAYVINLPYFFAWILNIVKSIASEATMKKLRIYADDSWKEDMLKEIDANVLPEWFGQPDFITTLNLPNPVPEHYYLRNQCKLQKNAENVTQCLLRRRGKQEVPMFIDNEGSTIVWNVECRDADINVGLFYKNRETAGSQYGESKLEEIIPFARAGGQYGPLNGSYVNKKSGVYVLVFDNTFSIIRSKHVYYTVDVLPPVTKVIPDKLDNFEYICAE